jgi:hypothetical protein
MNRRGTCGPGFRYARTALQAGRGGSGVYASEADNHCNHGEGHQGGQAPGAGQMARLCRPCHVAGLGPPGHENRVRHRHQTHREEQQRAGQREPKVGRRAGSRIRGVRGAGISGLTAAPSGPNPSCRLLRRDTRHRRGRSPPGLPSGTGGGGPGRGRRGSDRRRCPGGGAGPGRWGRSRRRGRRGGGLGNRGRCKRGRRHRARRERAGRGGGLSDHGRRNRGLQNLTLGDRLPRGRRRGPVRVGRAGRTGGRASAGDRASCCAGCGARRCPEGSDRDGGRGRRRRNRPADHRRRRLGSSVREAGGRSGLGRRGSSPGQHSGNDPRLLLGQLTSPGRRSRNRRLGSRLAGRRCEDTATAGAAGYLTSRNRATPRANHPYIRYRVSRWARYRDSFRAWTLGSRRADTAA